MPNRNSNKRGERNRRDGFLDAARELFFAHGYRGTTMEQIARHAGYSKRTVYLDYLNKDELFISVCSEGLELLLEKLKEVPTDEFSIEECLNRFTEVYVEFSREHGEYFRMIFSEAKQENIANCSDGLRERIAGLERACLNTLVTVAEEKAVKENIVFPIDPWEVAGIFVGSATGIILLSMGGSQTVFSKETLELLVKKAVWMIYMGLLSSETREE